MASAKLLVLAALVAADLATPVIKGAAVGLVPIKTTTPAAGTPVTANVHVVETTPLTVSTPNTTNVHDTGTTPAKPTTHVVAKVRNVGITPDAEETTPIVAMVHDVTSVPVTGTTTTTSEQPRPSSPTQGQPEDKSAAGQDIFGDDEPVNAQQLTNIILAFPRQGLYDDFVRVIYDVRKTTSVHVERITHV